MSETDNRAAAEYAVRLTARVKSFTALDGRHRVLGNAKVAVLLAGAALCWISFGSGLCSPAWILAPIAVFIWLAVVHEQVINERSNMQRAVTIYRDAIDRMSGRWAGRGSSGSRFRSYEHPYAEDLDLFGPGSLFEMMCAARTRTGEERLAQWLGTPGEVNEVRARQEAVADMRESLDLREDIAVLGAQASEAANLDRLRKWAVEPMAATGDAIRIGALVITAISVMAAAYAIAGFSRLPLEISILVGQTVAFSRRKPTAAAMHGIDRSAHDLETLAELLSRLEKESFNAPALMGLSDKLSAGVELPSHRIGRLVRIVSLRDLMRSNFFAIFGAALLWNTHAALAMEKWRRESGRLVPEWIDVVGSFEAFCSLARFAYEQPDAVFPELDETDAVLEAVAIRHPLLPVHSSVANSLTIGPEARLYIVSGSNMSGKSTLLRTLGINVALALAGAPVCAERLRVGPLHIGASLRTADSLQAGISRFYAEIKRLRQIVDIGRETPPALFLLDEILHGTNSHDRTVGAEAVIRALLAAGAVGLVTTHDLALARIADDKALNAVNVHFQDEMVEGKMVFDYKLRPGIVQKSNAIPLMRAVGLDV